MKHHFVVVVSVLLPMCCHIGWGMPYLCIFVGEVVTLLAAITDKWVWTQKKRQIDEKRRYEGTNLNFSWAFCHLSRAISFSFSSSLSVVGSRRGEGCSLSFSNFDDSARILWDVMDFWNDSTGLTLITTGKQLIGNVDIQNYSQRQSELPRPILQNSVESDHGCTSRIYFDNAGDNMTLTLYNVTLTSQKLCSRLQQNKRLKWSLYFYL